MAPSKSGRSGVKSTFGSKLPDLGYILPGVEYHPKPEDVDNLYGLVGTLKGLGIKSCAAINVKASPFFNPTLEGVNILEKFVRDPYPKQIYGMVEGLYRVYHDKPAKVTKQKDEDEDDDDKVEEDDKLTISEFYSLASRHQTTKIKDGWKELGENVEKCEKEFWSVVRRRGNGKNPIRMALYAADQEETLMSVESSQITLMNTNCFLSNVMRKFFGLSLGITTPMLYVGVWLSIFCMHLEDWDLWSVSYLHSGAPKIWYVLAPEDARKFEEAVSAEIKKSFEKSSKDKGHNHYQECQNVLRHKQFLVDPDFCKKYNLRVWRIVQKQGDMVVLHPRTYHQGFNLGDNVAESVNFAFQEDIPYIFTAKKCPKVKNADSMPMEFLVMEKNYQDFLKMTTSSFEVTDPFDPTLKVYPKLELEEHGKEYEFFLESVESIQAFCNGWVYARLGDTRYWYQKETVEKLKWVGTDMYVKIPESHFDSSLTQPPPPLFPPNATSNQDVSFTDQLLTQVQNDVEVPNFSVQFLNEELNSSPSSTVGIGLGVNKSAADWESSKHDNSLFPPCKCGRMAMNYLRFNSFQAHLRECGAEAKFICRIGTCTRKYKSNRALNFHQKKDHDPEEYRVFWQKEEARLERQRRKAKKAKRDEKTAILN